MSDDNLGDRIRARRAARLELLAAITDELKAHIDGHMAALHTRLDKLEKQ